MRRTMLLIAAAIILTASSVAYFGRRSTVSGTATLESSVLGEQPPETNLVSAPGVVEALSEEIEIGSEIPGKLKSVDVEEGQRVLRGQIVAVIENADYRTAIATAEAQVETLRSSQATARVRSLQAQTDRERIANGSRAEEREEARAAFEQTLPDVENSRREFERRERLYTDGVVSREEFERFKTTYENAQKRSRAANEHFNLVNADARRDDLAKADTAIKLAETEVREYDAKIAEALARVREAESRLSKTIILSPITGIILRKRLKSGESISPENQTGIVTVADTSALRVRIDLDENDVAKIKENQGAFVTADAYGKRRFTAKVIKIGQILGRKNFKTDRPTEKVDTKILEVLLELAPDEKLPLGLRVDAFITVAE